MHETVADSFKLLIAASRGAEMKRNVAWRHNCIKSKPMVTIKMHKMHIIVIIAFLFIIVQGSQEHLSNYTNAKVSCHYRGGLITQKLLKCDGLINTTCELGVDNSLLKDGESVWIKGKAQSGPYIALHTCMRFRNQDKHSFARNMTFFSNIQYECSVFCDQILHSTGFLGIHKDSCFCMSDSFHFPHTPECLETDFMDTHKRLIVFRLMGKLLFYVQSKSANFNCLGASIQKSGKTSYYNTKCLSTLYSICTQRVDSDLSNECLPRVDEFCFKEENSTFLDHYRKCWLYNGTLIPFNSGITVSLNYSVMLGSFRAVKAIEEDGENNGSVTRSCLSITKFNGIIYLETENCSNENALICMDDLINASNKDESQTKYGDTRHTVSVTWNTFITSRMYPLITISLAIVLVFCCTFYVPRLQSNFKRRNKTTLKRKKEDIPLLVRV